MVRLARGRIHYAWVVVGVTTVMRAVWQLDLLWGMVVGIGTGSMAGVLAATVANRWFVARRGLVTGVLTAASATGQLVFLPVLASLAVGQGWRWASATVALATLAAVPAVALLMRDDPARIGLRPYRAPKDFRAPDRIGNPFSSSPSPSRAAISPCFSSSSSTASTGSPPCRPPSP